MAYTVIKMADIKETLGSHWRKQDIDEQFGYCSICGERVYQTHATCEVCGTPVVWYGSKPWKELHGDPATAEKNMKTRPVDRTGLAICNDMEALRFPSLNELKRWNHCLRALGDDEMHNIYMYCKGILDKRNNGMHGLLKYVLNTAEKELMEQITAMANASMVITEL